MSATDIICNFLGLVDFVGKDKQLVTQGVAIAIRLTQNAEGFPGQTRAGAIGDDNDGVGGFHPFQRLLFVQPGWRVEPGNIEDYRVLHLAQLLRTDDHLFHRPRLRFLSDVFLQFTTWFHLIRSKRNWGPAQQI